MNMNCEPEFCTMEKIERLIQPYSENSLEMLKRDLTEDPELRVIHVWKNSHLSDQERFEICRQYGMNFSMEDMSFQSIDEAAVYVCKNELERQDLAPEYRKYLIGQRYYHEYNLHAESGKNDSKLSVAALIAGELNISAGTVLKYALYAAAVNVIFDEDTTFAKDILIGRLKVSHENIIELSRLRPEEIRSIAKSSYNEKSGHITLSFIRNEVKWSHVLPRNPVSKRERAEEHMRIKPAIRQMPEYDPDSEVNSLCMTIDSWISSIKRVNNSENFPKITHTASAIEIKIQRYTRPNEVFAVLIHECMHYYMRLTGLGFSDVHKNEILTDTATIYFGFYDYIYSGYIHVGYIKESEIKYINNVLKQEE